jgi:hypothetical protein
MAVIQQQLQSEAPAVSLSALYQMGVREQLEALMDALRAVAPSCVAAAAGGPAASVAAGDGSYAEHASVVKSGIRGDASALAADVAVAAQKVVEGVVVPPSLPLASDLPAVEAAGFSVRRQSRCTAAISGGGCTRMYAKRVCACVFACAHTRVYACHLALRGQSCCLLFWPARG